MRSLFTLFLITHLTGFTQSIDFNAYYAEYPLVPKGLIEAVSYTNTRMQVLDPGAPSSCTGMPKAYGILGLFDGNTSYFNPNGEVIAALSGISVYEQKENAQREIQAYAHAFHQLMLETGASNSEDGAAVYVVLSHLSEIPDSGKVNLFARDAQVYEILKFLNDPAKANEFNFPVHQYALVEIFGEANLAILNSPKVRILENEISNATGSLYDPAPLCRSVNYSPAIWTPAATCNFSSRNGTAISAITIHTVQGTYAGCISWFQNCSASVSAHYVIRSSDGQVTQMVDEADKAWHVGSENPYTIGYEHEGYVNNASWYTEAMYSASAALSRDIVGSGYGIPALRTYFGNAGSVVNVVGNCTKIKGHQHYPNQTHTDPGINWNWEKYYRLINDSPTIQSITTSSGAFYDSGGQTSNYTDDERKIWVFEPANATSVTLNFTSFNLENNWDFLFLYDGNSIDAPLIGKYTGTTGPGTITSTGSSITVEFRSDCATSTAGWEADYSSAIVAVDNTPPTTLIAAENSWRTENFTTSITDADPSGVTGKFVLISDRDPATGIWSGNGELGYAEELFEVNMDNWTAVTGPFALNNGAIACTDAAQTNSNCYLNVVQDAGTSYLYAWDQTFTSALTNQRAGMHFFCDDPTLPNRGNSYFVFLRETDNVAQIYKVVNDTWTLVSTGNIDVVSDVSYASKVTYEPTSGWIKYYINDSLIVQWQDPEPLQSGNSISLRTAGCSAEYDNVSVYKSRSETVSVEVSPSGHMRYESLNALPTGKVKSLALDLYDNWSLQESEEYLIDWSIPELTFLNDGSFSNDIDTITTALIEGNWLAVDIHSSIGTYEIAIGTLPSLNDIMDWTDLGTANLFSQVLSTTEFGTTYHIALRATNGAGLTDLFVSDGQTLIDPNLGVGIKENTLAEIGIFPNPASDHLYFSGFAPGISYTIVDSFGKKIFFGDSPSIDISNWAAGMYTVLLQYGSDIRKEKVILR
jgi:N-acetyl-anhydromuramyl-L-alanine amidase AmpD